MSSILSGTAAPPPVAPALPPGLLPPAHNFASTTALRFDLRRAPHSEPKRPILEHRGPGENSLPSSLLPLPCVEGLPLAKRETLRRYGPNILPLFYTARRAAPEQLTWEALTPHLPSRFTFGLAGQEQEIETRLEKEIAPGIASCSLAEFAFQPGVVYAWRVEPLDAPDAAPAQEGRFWLLDAKAKERCLQGCRALTEGGDRDFVALGIALFLTELELYQDALELIKCGPARAERDSRVLLAHTAQALVYRQMAKNLTAMEEQRAAGSLPPAEFLAWAANRERYHSDLATAQMNAVHATETTPARAISDRRAPVITKAAA